MFLYVFVASICFKARIMFKLYLSVFVRLLSVFNVNCLHQGSESYAISILCMYVCAVHVAELTIKQTDFDTLDSLSITYLFCNC